MSAKKSDRRQFLRNSAALAGLAAGALAAHSVAAQNLGSEKGVKTDTEAARTKALDGTPGPAPGQDFDAIYGVRSRYETSGRTGGIGAYSTGPDGKAVRPYIGGLTPIQDLIGTITPSALHYFNNHGYLPPDIDPSEHRLLVHGMVDRPMIFTMEDIYRLPSVTRAHFLECNANGYTANPARRAPEATAQSTHGLTSCSLWTGVQASRIMEMVGVQKGATWIVAEGAEGAHHSKSIPMWKVMDDALIVYGQNGEAIRPEQGYPLRILLPGFEAINSIKYLRRIKVVDTPYFQERETSGYQTVMHYWQVCGRQSAVVPIRNGAKVCNHPPFRRDAGGQGILRDHRLGLVRRRRRPQGRSFHRQRQDLEGRGTPGAGASKGAYQIYVPWKWGGEETVLLSRTTDERGQVQPTLAELGKLWGVDASYFTHAQVGHTNAIQPWRIASDGMVYNAIV